MPTRRVIMLALDVSEDSPVSWSDGKLEESLATMLANGSALPGVTVVSTTRQLQPMHVPSVCCATCKGTNVQTVDWVYPNTETKGVWPHTVEIACGDPFSDGSHADWNWCDDCDAPTILEPCKVIP